MSLIETIKAKLVDYKANLIEFPYEFKNKEIIHLIKTENVYADSVDYLRIGNIAFINKHIIAISVDRKLHDGLINDFLDLFIDFKNNTIAFTSDETREFNFDRLVLPTLDVENNYLAESVIKEVMDAITAIRLIS